MSQNNQLTRTHMRLLGLVMFVVGVGMTVFSWYEILHEKKVRPVPMGFGPMLAVWGLAGALFPPERPIASREDVTPGVTAALIAGFLASALNAVVYISFI